jgi:hypothetical protein
MRNRVVSILRDGFSSDTFWCEQNLLFATVRRRNMIRDEPSRIAPSRDVGVNPP